MKHKEVHNSEVRQKSTEDLKTTYKQLYEVVDEKYDLEELTRFFPIEGFNYSETWQWKELPSAEVFRHFIGDYSKHIEPAVHLMIVGRCANGWHVINEHSEKAFWKDADHDLHSSGFHWLRDDGKGVETYIRRKDNKECRYNINRSAFWRVIKSILAEIKPITTIYPRWFEHMVWVNLYPIAPKGPGSPDSKMKAVQQECSRQLLMEHIEYYAPSHILFLTDWDGWFENFADLFEDVKKVGDSAVDNIVGKGTFGDAKVVVTVKPDRKKPNRPNEDQFVQDVLSAFAE